MLRISFDGVGKFCEVLVGYQYGARTEIFNIPPAS